MDFRAYVRARVPPLALAREPEILDELAQHLADLYQEGLADGLSHEAALARASTALPEYPEVLAHEIRLANRALPGIIAGRWTMPDEAGPRSPGVLSMFDDVRRDLRYAVRMLARTLGFTAVVVLTMALGIGANIVIFSAVDAILLRSAPVVDPDRVMSVYTSGERAPFQSSSYADFADVRDSGVLESVAAFASISVAFDASGTTDAVPGEVVSGNYFDVLGVRMATGRSFTSEEDRPETPSRVVVLSHAFWQRRFEGDGEVVGRVMAINGQPYTVIGVASRDFLSPLLGRAPDLWVPMALQPEVRPPSAGVRRAIRGTRMFGVRDLRWLNIVGRLREGHTLQESQSALDVVASRLRANYPESNRSGMTLHISTWSDPMSVVSAVRAAIREIDPQLVFARPRLLSSEFEQSLGAERMMAVLVGLFAAVALLLAVVGLYGVMAHLASQRTTEIGIRLALGARPSSIVRLMVGSGLRLVGVGTILGLAGAVAGTRLLANQLFGVSPTDPATFGAVVAVLLTVAVAACLIPARRATRVDPAIALRHP